MGDVDDDDEIEDSDWEVDWSLGVATSQDVPLRRCVLLCLAPQYDSMVWYTVCIYTVYILCVRRSMHRIFLDFDPQYVMLM